MTNKAAGLGRALMVVIAAIACLAWSAIYGYAILAGHPALDAHIYVAGSRAFLNGLDPWQASYLGFHYAAAPPTTVAVAPIALLPEPTAAAVLWGIGLLAALAIAIRFRRPWMLAFPPLVQGVLLGNPIVGMMALLLVAPAAAGVLKPHALVVLAVQRRWRMLAIASGILVLIGAPLWWRYVVDFGMVSSRMDTESGGGLDVWGTPLLIPSLVAFVALLRLDPVRASWLALPAFLPNSGHYTAIVALPILEPWSALLMAVPIAGLPGVVIIVEAVRAGWQTRRNPARPDRQRQQQEAPPASVATSGVV
jgi:hypothetical protein